MTSVDTGWDLLIARDDLARTELAEGPLPDAGPGDVVLKVERVGMTANNVTYALSGDALGYWQFFPTADGWGRVPLWGFADVAHSNVAGIDVGRRFYGYYPTSSHLVVRPDRLSEKGFRDATEHRTTLPGAYNAYTATDTDPTYEVEHEDLHILYRPLFITSLMLDDFLADNGFFGAATILMSSASSKTAYATAFCLQRRAERPRLVGLTSPGNVGFTSSLGCYDEVVSYDDVTTVSSEDPVLYADFAGSQELRLQLHEHLGDRLVYDAIIGAAHGEELNAGPLVTGAEPTLFFAPAQIDKRKEDWGPGAIQKLYQETWSEFVPQVQQWVDVTHGEGADGLQRAWLAALSGSVDPKRGQVINL
jgi:hypothetical protein